MLNPHRRWLRLLPCALVLLIGGMFVVPTDARADHKPNHNPGGGGGGGGAGATPPGVVVCNISGQVHVMDADGAGKTPLSPDIPDWGEPSHAVHGGHAWFLFDDFVAGTYPDGDQRRELFAIRDDGILVVQLTDNPDRQTFNRPHWVFDAEYAVQDGIVSWRALDWDPQTGTPLGSAIYAAPLAFDANGDILGLSAAPAAIVTLPTVDVNGGGPPQWEADGLFDWSPDGLALTWSRGVIDTNDDLYVVDLVADTETLILSGTTISTPAWSPDGSPIAFRTTDGIETIQPDGTGRTLVLADKGGRAKLGVINQWATWSPDGAWLLYRRTDMRFYPYTEDVYRANADGSGAVNLTGDTSAFAFPMGWR